MALLTNDDGADAAGIVAFRAALVAVGFDVVTIAPETNHSSAGHGVTTSGYLDVHQVDDNTFICGGTPSDCVRVGLLTRVMRRPDIVVTGINHGSNAGEDLHYSGTVAAAAEAAMLGLPALAVSQVAETDDFLFTSESPAGFPDADYAARLARRVVDAGLPVSTLLSLNLPPERITGPGMLAHVGRRDWASAKVREIGVADTTRRFDPWDVSPNVTVESGTDYACLADGAPSVSLLSVRGGLHDVLDQHLSWAQESASEALGIGLRTAAASGRHHQ
ncbi:MAG: 5'/3'-nucleotidase SurE [Nocardioidaceae bacterium]